MDPYAPIKSRWNFDCPADYRAMQTAGLLDHRSENLLDLSDVEWFDLPAIAKYDFDMRLDGLIPFAMEARATTWSWMRDKAIDGVAPVAYCPRDCDVAEVYAPSFSGCVYRMIVDDLRSTWLIEHGVAKSPGDATELFQRYLKRLTPFFKPTWVSRIEKLLERPFTLDKDGNVGVMSCEEADEIIANDLAFPLLNLEFIQNNDSMKPQKVGGFFRTYNVFASHFEIAELFGLLDWNAIGIASPLLQLADAHTKLSFELIRTAANKGPVRVHYLPKSYYNRVLLAPLNLVEPSALSFTVPVESDDVMADFARALSGAGPFFINSSSSKKLMPLDQFSFVR